MSVPDNNQSSIDSSDRGDHLNNAYKNEEKE